MVLRRHFVRAVPAEFPRAVVQVGGMGHFWQMNGTMLATVGVYASDKARCTAFDSTIEMCGKWAGSALLVDSEAELALERCALLDNLLAVHMDDHSSVRPLCAPHPTALPPPRGRC